ncbi:hypothetical protein J6590_098838 [Homalodisca vitripennis]|nr:hypothetical protein J6590_098838 [Homalodisca vitripennis]
MPDGSVLISFLTHENVLLVFHPETLSQYPCMIGAVDLVTAEGYQSALRLQQRTRETMVMALPDVVPGCQFLHEGIHGHGLLVYGVVQVKDVSLQQGDKE